MQLQPETGKSIAKLKISHNYLILLFLLSFLVHTVLLSDLSVDPLYCLFGSISIEVVGLYAIISSQLMNNLEIKIQ